MAKQINKFPLLKLEYEAPNAVKVNHCLIRGGYPTEDFVKSLSNDEKASLVALFKIWGEMKGQMRNDTKFKKLEQYLVAIFEFKDYQVRLAGFWRPNYNFNLIYGFKKKQDKWPQTDLNTMRKNYDSFIEEEKHRDKMTKETRGKT